MYKNLIKLQKEFQLKCEFITFFVKFHLVSIKYFELMYNLTAEAEKKF